MTDSVYPSIEILKDRITHRWPEHATFIARSFTNRDAKTMRVGEQLAGLILKLAATEPGGIDKLSEDYRYLCEEIVLPEEVYFRRNGRYRVSKFADANAECYANAPFMSRYMNGLLLSNVIWANHAEAFASFVNDYLPRLDAGARHLEIGPGHGLFLFFAAGAANVESVTGWDISPTSIEKTRHALHVLGAPRRPTLTLRDLFDVSAEVEHEQFESIAMSEILEHLEDPAAALRAAGQHLTPEGLIFVNVPANSPAPDHIYLFEGLDHAAEIMESAGFKVIHAVDFPMSGTTIERARKHKLSVSCLLTGKRC